MKVCGQCKSCGEPVCVFEDDGGSLVMHEGDWCDAWRAMIAAADVAVTEAGMRELDRVRGFERGGPERVVA